MGIDRVNLWTLDRASGRPIVIGKYQAERIGYPKGQCDLMLRKDGQWFAVHHRRGTRWDRRSIPPTSSGSIWGSPPSPPIATATPHSGSRRREGPQEAQPPAQAAGARTPRGRRRRSGGCADKEARFRRHQNHVISKAWSETAKRTGRGIALEDLEGIRERVTARGGDAKNRLSVGRSRNSVRFWATRPDWREWPWSTWTPGTPAGPAPSAAIARRATGRAKSEFLWFVRSRANADENAARNIRARALSKRAPGLGNQPSDRVA